MERYNQVERRKVDSCATAVVVVASAPAISPPRRVRRGLRVISIGTMTQVPSRSLRFSSYLACMIAVGCGGAPPAETPATHAKSAAPAESTGSQAASAEASKPKTEPEADKPADPVITRTVGDRVFAPRMAYALNYPVSGAKEKAAQKCSVKFPEPGEARAACLEKERGKFTADVLVFEKNDNGQFVSIYRRSGNALSQMSKSKVALGEDTTEKLSFKVEDDKGWRSLFAGKKRFEVKMRDEYSIELDEPQYGNLVYEARIGMID
jgi:hypothetical protein